MSGLNGRPGSSPCGTTSNRHLQPVFLFWPARARSLSREQSDSGSPDGTTDNKTLT
ncbi:MAG: hypothetical protein WA816_00820 [Bacteroidales bacterium]